MLETLKQSFNEQKMIWIAGGVTITLLLIFGILSLFAGGQSTAQQQNTPTTDVTAELTWWVTDIEEGAYSKVIEKFKELPGNQGVNIQITKKEYGSSYYTELLDNFTTDKAPDIFTLRNDDLPAYKELLSPMDIFQGKLLNDYRNDFVTMALRDTMDKDQVYGITSYVDNLQLFYNRDLLNKNQLSRPAATWQELTNQNTLLSRRDVSSDTFKESAIALGVGGGQGSNIKLHPDIIPALIYQYGGEIYDYREQKPVLSGVETDSLTGGNKKVDENNPVYRAIRFYMDFADSNSNRYSWNARNKDAEELFKEGKLAYIINYRSFYDQVRKDASRLNFDVAELPQFNRDEKRTYGRFFMNVLNRSLKNRASTDPTYDAKYKKAQEFMAYMASEDAQQILADETKLPSAHRDVITKQQSGDQVTRIFASGALYAENYYKPDVQRTEQIWSQIVDDAQIFNKPLSEAIAQAAEEYTDIVSNPPRRRLR
jgi:ABC-type glycerol-3-phosphate transport system substrate-binding protein